MPGTVTERRIEQVATEALLVERRRAGEVFPRVPVGSVELTREQVAAGLYVQFAELPELPGHFTDVELLDILARALDAHGLAGLDDARRELEALPLDDRTAMRAYGCAYRLCVEHWYRHALCEQLSAGELTLALYASDIEVSRDRSALDRLSEVDGHLSEGVSRLGARTLALYGDEVEREFDHPERRVPFAELSEPYRALMPDARRRRFCRDLAVSRQWAAPRPLLAVFDEGGYAVGAVPPEDPHLIAFHRAFLPRSRRAQMEAAA
ncbi:hypothetical protein [Streptomyces sp. NPDC006510]|uniref:hypothetical protein n=1 Tax=Streptomyces sp. NPDC006510 TaxID=3155600 RepID=UPI0033AF4F3F